MAVLLLEASDVQASPKTWEHWRGDKTRPATCEVTLVRPGTSYQTERSLTYSFK